MPYYREKPMTDDELFQLQPHHIKDILDKGYCEVELPSGEIVVAHKEDLVFKKSEVDKFLEKIKSGNA